MATKNIKILNIIFLVLVFILGTMFFVVYLHDFGIQYPKGMISDFNDTGEYAINPETILLDLQKGKTDVFRPIIENSGQPDTPFEPGFFHWGQSNYLEIANTLHQFVWNEPLDDWLIFGLRFDRNCQDDPVGFDLATITYFKQGNQKDSYTVHVMEMYPLGGRVSWGGGEDSFLRPLFGWKNVDLQKLKVTADDALRIAEEKGGKEFRFKLKNACTILLVLKPNPDGNSWLVYYHPMNGSNDFSISIDPYTIQH